MNTTASEKTIESQIRFWSLLGPFFLLFSIGLLLFKLSDHWYFSLSALIGLPLCVKWRLKGLAAALATLFCFSLISYTELDLEERYWHVGMSLTLAFSLIVLALSLDEADQMIDRIQSESKSRLANLIHLEEAFNNAELTWAQEKTNLADQVQALLGDMVKIQEERAVFSKLVALSRDELSALHQQKEQLSIELCSHQEYILNNLPKIS